MHKVATQTTYEQEFYDGYAIISGASHQPTNFLQQYRIYIDKTKAPWEMISAPTVLVAMLRRCKACIHDLSQQLMTSRWKRDVFGPEIVTPCLFGSWQTQPFFHWHFDSLHLNWSWLKLWLRFQGRLKCIGWSHTAGFICNPSLLVEPVDGKESKDSKLL